MYRFAFKIFAGIFSLGVVQAQSAEAPSLEKLWETEARFQQPESVLYDPGRQVLYVSNVAGEPAAKDEKGFLSKVSLEGKVLELDWIKGLHAPKGLAYYGNRLYVSDIDTLVEIDLGDGKILNRYPAEGAQFLNDVATDGGGSAYVSDMMTDTIYRLSNGKLEVWLKSDALQSPNGLYVGRDGDLVVGSWGVREDGFKTKVAGHLKKVSIFWKSIQSLGSGEPVGNLDGVEGDSVGNYYATDWMAGKLFYIKPSGESTVLLQLEPGTADLGLVGDRGVLVIPLMNSGKLVAYEIEAE